MEKEIKEEKKKMEENSDRKRYQEIRRAVFIFEFKNSKQENLSILSLSLTFKTAEKTSRGQIMADFSGFIFRCP
jgi:hypothetical protein